MSRLEILKTYFWNKRYAPASCKKTEDFKMVQKKLLEAAFGIKTENIDKSDFLKKLDNTKKLLEKSLREK